jgi:hypothetical protein
MVEPSILQYRLQKDQQMLKEVVDVLLMRSKFSTPTCFGVWLPSSGCRECLIKYSSNVRRPSKTSCTSPAPETPSFERNKFEYPKLVGGATADQLIQLSVTNIGLNSHEIQPSFKCKVGREAGFTCFRLFAC